MKINALSVVLAIISLTLYSQVSMATSPSTEIKAFTANYSILHNSKPVGKATRKLSFNDDNTLNFSYESNIEWLIFSDSRREQSLLTLNDNTVIPMSYKYVREGTGRDKHYQWQYDAVNKTATNVKEKQTLDINWPTGLQDSLSYQLQVQLDIKKDPEQKMFVFPVINSSGNIKNHVYEFDGYEEVMLPYGLIKTVKLKREVIEKKRVTYVWLAPELDYLLVKLYQIKAGAEQFEAQLTDVIL